MRSWSVLTRGLLSALVTAALLGCGALEPVESYEPITDPTQLYVRLRLNHPAVTLSTVAPYDTLRLVATPLNAAGQPLSGLPAPTYRSSDTTRVWVTPEGLLQARRTGTNIRVIAELVTEGNLRQVDTATVNVRAVAAPPTPVSLTLDPVPPDSAVWDITAGNQVAFWGRFFLTFVGGKNLFPMLTPRVLDQSGTPMAGLVFEYESLDRGIVAVDRWTGQVTGPFQLGQVPIVVRSTVYGVPLADTVVFTTTMPVVNGIEILGDSGETPRFSPTEVTVRRNGYVFWYNRSWDSVEVTFDDPTQVADIPELCAVLAGNYCLAGNLPRLLSVLAAGTPDELAQFGGRRFPVPGTYTFRSTRTGNTGRVVVLDD